MMMTAEKLIKLLETADLVPDRYSGRGMYGRQCVSVQFSEARPDLFKLGVQLAAGIAMEYLDAPGEQELYPEDLEELEVRTDSMGHGSVVYFPGVAWEAEAR